MSANVSYFRRRIMANLKSTDGVAEIAVMDAINDAQKFIAMARDFDELMVLDTANAATVANTSTYHLTSNLGLTRPKDIYSIRYMDEADSRKLQYVPATELDQYLPYTLLVGTGRPTHYTRRGMSIELFRVPDANKSLYIFHSQWPATLSNDTDETPFLNIDEVIVELATEIAFSHLQGGSISDWTQRAVQLLGSALREEAARPDNFLVARPFCPTYTGPMGEYWNNPWIKRNP